MAQQFLLPTGEYMDDTDTITRTYLLPTGEYLTVPAPAAPPAGGGSPWLTYRLMGN